MQEMRCPKEVSEPQSTSKLEIDVGLFDNLMVEVSTMILVDENGDQRSTSNLLECAHFEECAAPLCPKDGDRQGHVWFPDEPVCRLQNVPEWVKKQRKIARLKGVDQDRFFTIRMLNEISSVRRNLQGQHPDYQEMQGCEKLGDCYESAVTMHGNRVSGH